MKLKANLKLRKIGSNHMIVDASTGSANLTNVYTLNATAARMWELAEGHDFTSQQLAEAICCEFDVEPQRALAEVDAQLGEWRKFGLITD